MASFVKVAAVGDVPPGTGKCVEAGGKQIALFNVGGTFHAKARNSGVVEVVSWRIVGEPMRPRKSSGGVLAVE